MTAGDVVPRPRTAAASTSGFLTSQKQQECVKVIVRCRPLSTTEISQGHKSIVNMHTDRGLIELQNPLQTSDPSKDFTFDAIYNESSKQQELYDETFRELVDSVLDGFNGTIFAYGQTGTGKTYTMEGRVNLADERGVIYNCFEHIFNHIAQSRNQQYLIRASYLEIYQEEIRDLLNKDSKQRLELKERPDGGVYVKDLVSYMTKSVGEIQNVMAVGNANRSTGRTNMNEHSSRSHAIFIITIECSETDESGESHIRMGRLNLVDLAGSERQAKTGATGERFKEATKINLSLSALGNVISALVDGKSTHIPYRDSKLTRLLQDSLGGNSKTVMVACIGPASYNFEETLGTLRYANRAKNIKNKPKINEDPKDAMLRQYQDEIAKLRAMLEKRKGRKDYDGNRGDEYYKEQRRSLEADKQKVLRDDSLVKEERKRIMAQLEEREKQLEREKAAQTMMTEKIAIMESKLLGGTDLIGQTKKQQDELQRRRKELAEQKKREREILQQLEQHEDDTAEIHQTFTSLQQELEAKNRKLYKFKLKLKKIRSELNDSERLHHQEREGLQRDVAELNKELKLKLLVVDNFIPSDVRDRVKDRAVWSDVDNTWQIPGARPLSSGTRPSTSAGDPGNFLIVEDQGLLTHSTGADSGVGLGEASTSSGHRPTPDFLDKRPTSIPGLRRPMSATERIMVDRAREQLSRQMRPLIAGNSAVEPIINEDIIRYCGENVLVFSGLERHQSEVVDFEAVMPNANDYNPLSEKLVVDASKTVRSRLRSPSIVNELTRSRSKNERARNANPTASPSPVIYPKSRGLFKPKEASHIETYKPQTVFNSRTSVKEVFVATQRFGLTSEESLRRVKHAVEQILYPPTDVQFTCASSESSESEGICADYVSKGAASMSSSFYEEELNLCGRLPPQFGRIVNLDQSIDIRSLVQTDFRRSFSLPRTSTPIVMASSCYDMPCTPRRPTKIPQPMSKSVSIGSPASRAQLIRDGSSASAPMDGSCEQLCDDFVDVRSEAKRLLERSRRRTPMRAAVYERRCAFPETGRMSLSTRRLNLSFSASPSRRNLIHRPQISRTGDEIVEKASIELSMLRSQIQLRFEAPRMKWVEPEQTTNRKRRRKRNCFGGSSPLSMERLIRWYRLTRTICSKCRDYQRIHRLSSHSTKPKISATGIQKSGVVSRSQCVCKELRANTVRPYPASSNIDRALFSENTQKLIDLAAFFAAIAFLLNLVLKILF